MKKQFKFSLWALVACFYLVSAVGNATTPKTGVVLEYGIHPGHITTETELMIGVGIMMSPCLTFSDSDPVFYHLSANNHITYVFSTLAYAPCPHTSSLIPLYTIGQLPEGDYTMQVYTVGSVSQIPTSINDPLGTPFGDLVNFTVYAPAAPVPAIGFLGGALMIITVLLSLFLLKKWPVFNMR